jgi:DHA2 family multidrug resistance protein
MLPRGLGSFLFMPIVGILMGKIESKRLLIFGLCVAGFSLLQLARLNLQAGYWDIFWPQILQGAAMGLLFVPLTTITNDPIPKEQMGNATSLFNLMRNIGGSIGIAVMTTFLSRRAQVHQDHLVANVTAGSGETARLLQGMRSNFIAHGIDSVTAGRKALAAVYGLVQQHAAMLAFVEAFFVMGVVFLLMLPFLLLLQYSKVKRSREGVTAPAAKIMASDVSPKWAHESAQDTYDEEHHLVMH